MLVLFKCCRADVSSCVAVEPRLSFCCSIKTKFPQPLPTSHSNIPYTNSNMWRHLYLKNTCKYAFEKWPPHHLCYHTSCVLVADPFLVIIKQAANVKLSDIVTRSQA